MLYVWWWTGRGVQCVDQHRCYTELVPWIDGICVQIPVDEGYIPVQRQAHWAGIILAKHGGGYEVKYKTKISTDDVDNLLSIKMDRVKDRLIIGRKKDMISGIEVVDLKDFLSWQLVMFMMKKKGGTNSPQLDAEEDFLDEPTDELFEVLGDEEVPEEDQPFGWYSDGEDRFALASTTEIFSHPLEIVIMTIAYTHQERSSFFGVKGRIWWSE